MRWRIVWTQRALREASRLHRQILQRITEALERYAADEHGDVLRLKDIEPPEWRLRVGDWRVRFQLDFEERILYVLRVLPRDKAYR